MQVNIKKIIELHEQNKGTVDYNKFNMETYFISGSIRSRKAYIGHGIPHSEICIVRKNKGITWLIAGEYEYKANKEIMELITIIL